MVKEVLGRFHASNLVTCDEDIKLMNTLRDMRQNSRLCMKALFNESFGSTFLTDTGKESAFAYNVQRYADVYTSRLENFMLFSSDAWLYTPFDVKILPHHVKVLFWSTTLHSDLAFPIFTLLCTQMFIPKSEISFADHVFSPWTVMDHSDYLIWSVTHLIWITAGCPILVDDQARWDHPKVRGVTRIPILTVSLWVLKFLFFVDQCLFSLCKVRDYD